MAGYLPGERWLVVADGAAAYLDGEAADALRLWELMSGGAGARELLEAIVLPALARGDGLQRLGPFLLAVSEPEGNTACFRIFCRHAAFASLFVFWISTSETRPLGSSVNTSFTRSSAVCTLRGVNSAARAICSTSPLKSRSGTASSRTRTGCFNWIKPSHGSGT